MENIKPKMTASYRAIFIFSIFMIFVVLVVGAITKSNMSGIGMFFWGLTAWLMNKRMNSELVIFYKIKLWFDAIAFIFFAVIYFVTNDVILRTTGISSLIIGGLLAFDIFVTYALYRYFLNQSKNSPTEVFIEPVVDVSSVVYKNKSNESKLWKYSFIFSTLVILILTYFLIIEKIANVKNVAAESNKSVVVDVKEPCYLYWDGQSFQLGKTGGDKFTVIKLKQYGLDRLFVAYPKETIDFLKSRSEKSNPTDADATDEFTKENFDSISKLCQFP
jgi:hypothetical protein